MESSTQGLVAVVVREKWETVVGEWEEERHKGVG